MKSSVVKPLESGKPVKDIIAKGKTKDDELSSFRYYSLKVDSEHAIVTITVTSTQGDPDLYVSNNILPSTVDYTWKVNDVGKCRLVIFPGDDNFIVGTYMIGVFSAVPARFQLVADVSGGAYSSESVRNVERLTAKFNTVAEGFVNVSQKTSKPKSKVKILKNKTLTAKERAEAFAIEQANAEKRLKQLRKTVDQKILKISKTRARHIARLEKELNRSKFERKSLASSFCIETTDALEAESDYCGTDEASDSEPETQQDEIIVVEDKKVKGSKIG